MSHVKIMTQLTFLLSKLHGGYLSEFQDLNKMLAHTHRHIEDESIDTPRDSSLNHNSKTEVFFFFSFSLNGKPLYSP